MIDVNQLRNGTVFLHEDNLYKVIKYSHTQPGRGHAIIRVTVRNLRTGSNYDLTFSSGNRVNDVRLETRTHQYLYDDGQFYVFMDVETFDQKQLSHAVLVDHENYLRENLEIDLLLYGDEIVDYQLPMTMEFEVVAAENAIAGNTATGVTKIVTTDSGLQVRTPLFVNVGDHILVNTESGEYISRA